ncbi:MAG: GIY-YIG nuclease family protein [Actinomycetota bacterium]|nr:GIY-YIG nuclease family protein [Actinomycetota bacterium]
MSEAWVYILRCADGSLYTGWSTDVNRRLAQHRAGSASAYTASRLPVELEYVAAMADRGSALREEARIKALDRPRKLALIAGRGSDEVGPRRPRGRGGGVRASVRA